MEGGGVDRSICVHGRIRYARGVERNRQTSSATDIMPMGMSHVKFSIPKKTRLTVSLPPFAIKPYTLVLMTPLMVGHYCLPKLFVCVCTIAHRLFSFLLFFSIPESKSYTFN